MSLFHRTNAQQLRDENRFHSHWDPILKANAVKIFPGQYYVTKKEEVLVTILGSCISACIRDRSLGLGGMNHFMLPKKFQDGERNTNESPWNIAARYGNYAMELLINAILRNGGARSALEVKVFGGAQILTHMRDIGTLNINFIREYLIAEELPILAEDLGGCQPRKILYFPATGKVMVKRISPLKNAAIAREEMHYRSELNQSDFSGTIELFDPPEMD
jgi:chemotaxis protein CheD